MLIIVKKIFLKHLQRSTFYLHRVYLSNIKEKSMISAYCPIIPFKGTMLTTDLDGTMLIPSNEHMKIDVEDRLYCQPSIDKTEFAVKKNGIDSVLINTGRNYTELCEVQDILEKTTMPVSAISLEDGKRLLKKPKNLSTQDWMKLLFNKNINYLAFKDESWTQLNEAPLKAIGQYLTKEKGFIHRNDNGEKMIYSKPIELGDVGVKSTSKDALWIITLVPPAINFEVSVRDTKDTDEIDVEAFNKAISSEIEQMLQKQGFKTEAKETKEQVSFVNTIERQDVSKGTVADYVRKTTEGTTKEIRAGNAGNDISMLKTDNPNIQSVLVGDDKTIKSLLAHQANVTYVPVGELGSGIDNASQKLNLSA